ncbi:FAD-dependent oxidoreductase [Paraburkholderia sp. LEh10]|uniref:NAD(P)/FAD-dependent oxidoreductase n=1 Tax=Paraburkholderia sp. LEh10 TaxID=2821353 RepID=UPI001AE6B644|nr:FAD-dependent oxidoreductase [Paraburkholderia sp. LEh10]MBP0590446.1 FAD-dependent oxidoreductase [Paraburkholderia sp. LEh10]
MAEHSVVVVGGGHGGFQTAASLRQSGYKGVITLISDEPGLPYQRPPLSKAYVTGKINREALHFRPERFFDENRIRLVCAEVVKIDRTERLVHTRSGEIFNYDHLVLAMGARNRPLTVPGSKLNGVFGLRSREDADLIIPRLASVRKAIVVGAGFIGLEFAAVASTLGASVEVLELADRPMARATSPTTSRFFRSAHEAWGTEFHFQTGLASIEGEDGRVTAVATTTGKRLETDLVVFGIGVQPNVTLAADAGLEIDGGIKVDEFLVTSDPAISAIGDVAAFPNQSATGLLRLESVQNAVDHARCVANRLCGKPNPYRQIPWFWSDQRDLKLQIVGLNAGHDTEVVCGDLTSRQFSVLCYKQNDLISVESVNRPADHMIARKVIGSKFPSLEEALGPNFELRAWHATIA